MPSRSHVRVLLPLAAALLGYSVLHWVFVPFLVNNFYVGQYFGESPLNAFRSRGGPYAPGHDFGPYYVAPQVAAWGANPYSDAQTLALLRLRRIELRHPNPVMAREVIEMYLNQPQAACYLGSPFTLLYFFPLQFLSYEAAFNLWVGISITALGAAVTLFARRLLADQDVAAKASGCPFLTLAKSRMKHLCSEGGSANSARPSSSV